MKKKKRVSDGAKSADGRKPRNKTKGEGRLSRLLSALRNENLPKIVLFIIAIVVVGGGLIYLTEFKTNPSMFSKFFDAIWWGVVTVTTVGYGDTYPSSSLGRVLAIIVMLQGVVITSILSGTVASIFVDRKLREGKGLQEVVSRNHTVICGWNKNSEGILYSFLDIPSAAKPTVVLVNEMDPEAFQEIKARISGIELRYVRGDFTNERVLRRGSVGQAKAAIVVPDQSGDHTFANADERTILAVLAIKSINPDIITCAEIVNQENEQHLRRANVDDILVGGEFSGYLLANATEARGVPTVVREMLSRDGSKGILKAAVPSSFIGKSFKELSEHFLDSGKGILIGMLSEEKQVNLDELLSDDSSSIDAFIKRKFMEAEIDISEEENKSLNINLSPGPEYMIKETDTAFLIGARVRA